MMSTTQDVSGDLLRFNGTFTVESPSGEHRTFRIRTREMGHGTDRKPMRVISMLIGPQNTSDFEGFGFVVPSGRTWSIVIWKAWRGDNPRGTFSAGRYAHDPRNSPHQAMAATICDLSMGDASVLRARGFRVLASTTCRRCNRDLTTPESIESGIGPVCAEMSEV